MIRTYGHIPSTCDLVQLGGDCDFSVVPSIVLDVTSFCLIVAPMLPGGSLDFDSQIPKRLGR